MIHARGRGVEYPEHEAPLSIKCVLQGQEIHEVRGIPYRVDEASCLLLNHGQRYSSRIGPEREAETFSIFFEREFAEQALRSLVEPATRLLDEPDAAGHHPVRFVESLYPRDAALSDLLESIRRWGDAGDPDPAGLDERLYAVLGHLLSRHSDLLRLIEALPAVRAATRLEQYRRVSRARDYIDANLTTGPSLAEIARVACLSSYHLLRLFKQAFGVTPHRYATDRRLARARTLLEGSDLPVSAICKRVGYRSLGSFSHLFRKRYEISPRKLRSRSRRSQPGLEKARTEKNPASASRSLV